ncbi:nucleotidyltransferase family protein [Micrococcoides hystricis]|uniref:Nucleotidyltransferase family protein n=1 Tax=Micrococcoides hystricis TaxID=1572761 RepID=A0ABV6PA29_9MICC
MGCREQVVPFYESCGWKRNLAREKSIGREGEPVVDELGPPILILLIAPLETWPGGDVDLRKLLAARRDEFQMLLDRYGATNPNLFESVARGTATAGSDIDILVEIDPAEAHLLPLAEALEGHVVTD